MSGLSDPNIHPAPHPQPAPHPAPSNLDLSAYSIPNDNANATPTTITGGVVSNDQQTEADRDEQEWQTTVQHAQAVLQQQAAAQHTQESFIKGFKTFQMVWRIITLIGLILLMIVLIVMKQTGQFGP